MANYYHVKNKLKKLAMNKYITRWSIKLCGVLVTVVCDRVLCGITWLQSDRYSVWDHFVTKPL